MNSSLNATASSRRRGADVFVIAIHQAHEESDMPRPAATIASTSIASSIRRLLAIAGTLIVAAIVVAAPKVHAADKAASEPASREVRGVKLASICSVCGVVSDVRAETRDAPSDPKGAIAGAVVGGLAGHGMGGGSGRTAMTVLGVVGGGVAGNAIEKKMNRVTVWTTTVVFKDGTVRSYERDSGPNVEPGDIVVIAEGKPARVER
jgi:outer membrane lipoprotein SlyB